MSERLNNNNNGEKSAGNIDAINLNILSDMRDKFDPETAKGLVERDKPKKIEKLADAIDGTVAVSTTHTGAGINTPLDADGNPVGDKGWFEARYNIEDVEDRLSKFETRRTIEQLRQENEADRVKQKE